MIAFAALSFALLSELPRLMVLPPELSDSTLAADTERTVDAAARALDQFRVLSKQERDALVTRAANAGLRCDVRTADCGARIGAFGTIDFVLVTALDDASPRNARVALYDCTDGRVVREAEAPLATEVASDDAHAAALRLLTRAAAGESVRLDGTLHVEASGAGDAIAVEVDGASHGAAPLTLTLAAGVHDVVLRAPSGAVQRVRAVVPLASVARVTPSAVGLAHEEPPATGPSAAFVGGLALGGVGALGGVAAGAAAWFVAPDVKDRASLSAREYNDAVALGRTLVVLSALGGAALVLGGAVAAVSVVTSE
jgi:hypothetical protein